MEESLSTRKVLYDIALMKQFAKQLLGKGKEYEKLLSFICEQNYDDEDIKIPPLKEIQLELGISYGVFKRLLLKIYEDLYELELNEVGFTIKKTEYWLRMFYFDNYACVILNELPIIPRVGEYIEVPFFSAKVGTTSFYVHSIQHRLSTTKQIIDITLNPGMYNYYWRIRKDEAFLKAEITWDEYFDHMDYDTKKKLKLLR